VKEVIEKSIKAYGRWSLVIAEENGGEGVRLLAIYAKKE